VAAGRSQAARVAILADDEMLIAEISSAVQALNGPVPLILGSHAALLTAVLEGISGFAHLFLQEGARHVEATLLDALAEASPTALISPFPVGAAPGRVRILAQDVLEGRRMPAPQALSSLPGMANSLNDGGLLLRYQPIVRVRDRRLVMVEALARWRSNPVALGPGMFVPALERAGLARLLAGAVTRIAARDMMRLRTRTPLAVSVNLPVEELEKRDTLAWLAQQLKRSRLPRARLAIELTETSPVRDFTRLGRSVRRLRAAGHEVLIDDFELDDRRRRLLRLPFSGVKLDKGFVGKLARSARARQQVRTMAREGLSMTAEGVSTPAIWRSLRHLGVARAQGFWLARPLPIAALPAWSARWRGQQPG